MRNNNFSRRLGFTVVELLVVVAMLGIASAILLPVIQSHREAGRNSFCQQRIAALALGSQTYEMINGRLPMQLGVSGAVELEDWNNPDSPSLWAFQQNSSPLLLVASLDTTFEIDPIFFDYNVSTEPDYFFDLDGWEELSILKLPRFRCPSDLQRLPVPTEGHYLALQPLIGNGEDLGAALPDTSSSFYGITNYQGCLGAGTGGAQNEPDPTWQYRGMITSRELRTLDEVSIADGLSNTIMYGETIGERTQVGRQVVVQVLNSWLSGGVARGRGFVPWMEESTVVTPLLGRANRSSALGFGSTHRGGVNFAFGDGSVHLLTRDIAVLPYYEMCGAFDTQ